MILLKITFGKLQDKKIDDVGGREVTVVTFCAYFVE